MAARERKEHNRTEWEMRRVNLDPASLCDLSRSLVAIRYPVSAASPTQSDPVKPLWYENPTTSATVPCRARLAGALAPPRRRLKLGAWNFIGGWCLVLPPQRRPVRASRTQSNQLGGSRAEKFASISVYARPHPGPLPQERENHRQCHVITTPPTDSDGAEEATWNRQNPKRARPPNRQTCEGPENAKPPPPFIIAQIRKSR